jgi:glutamate synthase (NADPH/NADH) large chain
LNPWKAKTIQQLYELIAKHVATGSPRGKWILEKWDEMLPRFLKVFPHEYKRVMLGERALMAPLRLAD